MKGKKIVSTLLALLLLASLPVSALAAEWDIGKGDITVNAGSGGQTVTQGSQVDVPDSAPVITGSSTENTLTINAEKDQTANVTLSDVNIDVSSEGKAAVSTTGEGNVSIELNGDNTLKSGKGHAGLEKKNGGKLTIADEDKNGKLTAEGGKYGAGIGGGDQGAGSGITITGGEIKATGGQYGAGIGGGPMPALNLPPVALTSPPVMIMSLPMPYSPPPMPAPYLPPVALTSPSVMVMSLPFPL